jgi:hypothetical protein
MARRGLNRKLTFISVLFIAFVGVLIYQFSVSKDLKENGINKKAAITYYRYFSYISNEMTAEKVRFLRINYKYSFNNQIFEQTEDLPFSAYQNGYFKNAAVGDSIYIIISKINPDNSTIKVD